MTQVPSLTPEVVRDTLPAHEREMMLRGLAAAEDAIDEYDLLDDNNEADK